MDAEESIARLGFRRWYGRQLYVAYAWLATCLLGGVLFAAILEFVGVRGPGLAPYFTLVVLYLVGLMSVHTFRRFWMLLSRAQRFADRATCPRCETYGHLDLVDEHGAATARCRDCGARWPMA